MVKKWIMLSIPVLLGVLLIATLVGVAGARPNARPEASPALVDYMFSGFNCAHWNAAASTLGSATAYLSCTAGSCAFACPIKPPHEGLIRVQRLAMYAFDNDGAPAPSAVGIILIHHYPKTGAVVARVGEPLGAWTTDNVADPAVYSYNPPNFKVSTLQDIYVVASVASAGQKLYGFKLKYEPL
jgi:hypothetical protein